MMAWLYTLTVAVMALTGFGQMPIYNRYYMSDIPGLGWLADFYATRQVHYIGAAVLLALIFYTAADFLLLRRKQTRFTGTGYLRLVLLAGIVLSGALIVIKNFPYVHFADGFVIGMNLFHLGMVMAFLMTNLLCRVTKQRWTAAR
jgi:uncharacterized membrane protein YadS